MVTISRAKIDDFLDLPKEQGSTVWDLEAVKYAFLENEFTGGCQLLAEYHSKKYFFFAIKKEDHFFIDYHNIDTKTWNSIKDSVFSYLNCEKIIFREYSMGNIIGLSDSEFVNENSRITLTLG